MTAIRRTGNRCMERINVAAPSASGKLHAFPMYDTLSHDKVAANLNNNVPDAIKALKAFVVFKYKPAKTPGGKRGKVPYYVRTMRPRRGTQGTAEDLSGMSTFAKAMRAFEEQEDIAGIGICAIPSNPYCFVDIDNCFDPKTGELNDIATELLRLDTYAEFSPGGHGLRLILDGNLGIDAKNMDIGLELFSHKGFVTLTGMPFGKAKAISTPTDQNWHRLQELLGAKKVPELGTQDPDQPRSIPSPLSKARTRDVKTALRTLDPDMAYPDWLSVGQALHSGAPDPAGIGFKLWLAWSSKGSKFAETNEEEMLAKWRGFGAGRGVTLNTLFHMAQEHGFDPKQPKAADPFDADAPPIRIQAFVAGNDEPDRQLDPVCPGLFDHTGAYIFVGRAKIGKSRILGLMVASALVGGKVFDYRFLEPCRTLAIALEERTEDVLERCKLYLVDPSDHKDQLMVVDQDHFIEQGQAL
jgi:hypothetical protein